MRDRIERLKSAVTGQRFNFSAFKDGVVWPVLGLVSLGRRVLWLLGPIAAGFALDEVSDSFTIPWFFWYLYFAAICVAVALRADRAGVEPHPITARGSLVLGAVAVSIPMTYVVGWLWVAVLLFLLAWLLWRIFGKGTAELPKIQRGANSHYNADGSSKVAYVSHGDATDAARTFEERHRGESMNAYRCGQCSKWHIGHAR